MENKLHKAATNEPEKEINTYNNYGANNELILEC